MKRFKFSLEKVLKLRKSHEQEAKNELGKAISALNIIDNDMKQNAILRSDAAQERFAGINSGYAAGTASSMGVMDMIAWDRYIKRLEQEAERLVQDAARAEQVVEEKRSLYIEASRELKVMENLKDKRKTEYRKEMRDKE